MADHFSGPRALADPASDVTDVFTFPSPERPGHSVLVLDVFPSAAPTALFSDALRYRFRVRPVTATSAGGTPAFVVGADDPRPPPSLVAGAATLPEGRDVRCGAHPPDWVTRDITDSTSSAAR